MQEQKTEEKCFYQNVQCVRAKNQTLSNKQREASGLLSSLRIKTALIKVPLVGSLLF